MIKRKLPYHRVEQLLKRFSITSSFVFSPIPWYKKRKAVITFMELMKNQFDCPKDTDVMEVYDELKSVWHNVKRRRNNEWHWKAGYSDYDR